MYTLTSEASFDSAHFLSKYAGKCKNIHGHRWTLKVEISGNELQKDGSQRSMLVDFAQLKKELKEICDHYDHALIIERDSLRQSTLKALLEEDFRVIHVGFRPTAEEFAKYFYNYFKSKEFNVTRVLVYETPTNVAEYKEV